MVTIISKTRRFITLLNDMFFHIILIKYVSSLVFVLLAGSLEGAGRPQKPTVVREILLAPETAKDSTTSDKEKATLGPLDTALHPAVNNANNNNEHLPEPLYDQLPFGIKGIREFL